MKPATRISAAQILAARALLGWSREALAVRCGVSVRTLASVETGLPAKDETMDAVRSTLTSAGIVFIKANGGGPGVRFAASRK